MLINHNDAGNAGRAGSAQNSTKQVEQIQTSTDLPPGHLAATPFDLFVKVFGSPPKRQRGKSAASLALIGEAKRLLETIQPASVRAVCYQLFVNGAIPNMSKASTQKVSVQLVHAREAGIIPWSWIVDETRATERVSQWEDTASFADSVQAAYRRDRWANQPRLVEVWSEKGTIRGTLAPVINRFGVGLRVMHGFSSATAVHDAAEETKHLDIPMLVLYVGDHDPSGLFMSEVDLPERIKQYGGNAEIRRIALDKNDVENGDLPYFEVETKSGDSRFKWFVERYGRRCWELDALSPDLLRDRVEEAILAEIDLEYWERCAAVERAERESLLQVMEGWKTTTATEIAP